MKFVLLCVSVSLCWIFPCAAQTQGKHETILHRHETASPAGRENKQLGEPGEPDAGDIHGDLYTNQFFGFRYTLPESLMTVTDILEGQEDLSQRAFVLLSLESEPEPGQHAVALTIAADKFTAPPSEKLWAPAYLKQLTEMVAKKGAQPVGATREYTFGSHKFFRLDFERTQPWPGFQTTVVGLRRGYALLFIFAAEKQEEIDALVQSLNSLKFSAVEARH